MPHTSSLYKHLEASRFVMIVVYRRNRVVSALTAAGVCQANLVFPKGPVCMMMWGLLLYAKSLVLGVVKGRHFTTSDYKASLLRGIDGCHYSMTIEAVL